MKNSLPSLIFGASVLLLAAPAQADHRYQQAQTARVLSADPIYTTIYTSHPQQICDRVAVPVRDRHLLDDPQGGALVGALVGGVIGHQFGGGRGRDVATVAGALIGASTGHRTSLERSRQRPQRVEYQQHCSVSHERFPERVLDGYHVRYRYQGQTYSTRMAYDPGPYLPIEVSVRPAGDY